MKLSKLSQLILVSFLGLSVAALLTACSRVTIDFVYVADSTAKGGSGQIESFAMDQSSGALRTITSAVAIGDSTPVAMAITSDYYHLYAATQGTNKITHFTIASSGSLTKADSVTVSGVPVSMAISEDNKYLYVVSSISSSSTASAGVYLWQYPLSSGTIGTGTSTKLTLSTKNSSYGTDTLVPTGVATLVSNTAVFVTFYDKSAYNPTGTTTSSANPGWIASIPVSSGTLGTPAYYVAGVMPTAVVADPTYRFVYVTDFVNNQLIGYTITSGYVLNSMLDNPFTAGSEPTAITIDPRGKFIYVANYEDNSVSGYTIDSSTGIPTLSVSSSGSSANATDSEPVAVAVDPALGRFVVTANKLGNSLSGFKMDSTSGALEQSQGTPYVTGYQPTAIALAPHGNHSTQTVTQ